MTRRWAGADPDLHCTAFAVVDALDVLDVWTIQQRGLKGRPAAIQMAVEVSSAFRQCRMLEPCIEVTLAVEGQKHLRQNNTKPDDLIKLAMVSGAILSSASQAGMRVQCPLPQEWKGSMPKRVHHARIGRAAGWEMDEPRADYVPPCPEVRERYGYPSPAPWKHIMDALGLALWSRHVAGWPGGGP